MFAINEDMSIYATRGDVIAFAVRVATGGGKSEEAYTFKAGDVVRFKLTEKKDCAKVVLQKEFAVEADSEAVTVVLTEQDTKIGEVISKPAEYWYEVELNPHTKAQTIIGYDEDGAKVLRLFPEGADIPPYEPSEEEIPVVDAELSLTSDRPIQNQAVAHAVAELDEAIAQTNEAFAETTERIQTAFDNLRNECLTEEGMEDEKCREIAEEVMSARVIRYAPMSVSASKWAADEDGGYSVTFAAEGMLETDQPIADVVLGYDEAENEAFEAAWNCIKRVISYNGSVKLWGSASRLPSDFVCKVKVVR